MSLKGSVSATELFDTIENAQKGKKKAIAELSRYVERGVISNETYEEVMMKCRINKIKKDRTVSQKIKSGIYTIISSSTLLISMLCTIAYLIEPYGKSGAFWYLMLFIFSIHGITSLNGKEITNLQRENEYLKSKLETHKNTIETLEHKVESLRQKDNEIEGTINYYKDGKIEETESFNKNIIETDEND